MMELWCSCAKVAFLNATVVGSKTWGANMFDWFPRTVSFSLNNWAFSICNAFAKSIKHGAWPSRASMIFEGYRSELRRSAFFSETAQGRSCSLLRPSVPKSISLMSARVGLGNCHEWWRMPSGGCSVEVATGKSWFWYSFGYWLNGGWHVLNLVDIIAKWWLTTDESWIVVVKLVITPNKPSGSEDNDQAWIAWLLTWAKKKPLPAIYTFGLVKLETISCWILDRNRF